ncbi:MAG: right-handed parallel beta-helix repeat-containing protein [Desulfosalsimonadaceae bacterium]
MPDPEPADFGSWLTTMDMNMYLLNAKTSNAPWIPAAAKNPGTQQYPWCLTWKVNAYTNMENQPLHVGASQQHKTVSAVLKGQPDQESISIVLHDSVSEPEPVMISGKSVSILGDYAALSNNGRPAITLSSLGFTVEEGAHLHLENLIIDSANIGTLPGISNRGSITIRNCTIKAGGDGIFQENGNLVLTNSLIVNCGGNGVKVAEGSLEAYNCELTSNHGYGLQLESGAAFLNHCSLLLNSTADLFSDGQTATAEALNSAFGVMSPDSRIFLMSHCLVETLPETVVIETQESCRMNTTAGYIYENGEIAGLSPNSALINAGMAKIPDTRDIRGNLRDKTPDIGYIEHTDLMQLQSIKDFNLQTITNPDPDTATDALAFTLKLKVPENLTLKKDGRYAVFFGDYLISSSDFDQSSIDSNNTPDGHPKSPTCGHLKIPHLIIQSN